VRAGAARNQRFRELSSRRHAVGLFPASCRSEPSKPIAACARGLQQLQES
jgi:hypothetical protein